MPEKRDEGRRRFCSIFIQEDNSYLNRIAPSSSLEREPDAEATIRPRRMSNDAPVRRRDTLEPPLRYAEAARGDTVLFRHLSHLPSCIFMCFLCPPIHISSLVFLLHVVTATSMSPSFFSSSVFCAYHTKICTHNFEMLIFSLKVGYNKRR